jgi:hypothetical protein
MVHADFSSAGLKAPAAIILAALLPKCHALSSLTIAKNSIGEDMEAEIKELCSAKGVNCIWSE